MRRLLALALIPLAVSACGRGEQRESPAACRADPQAYVRALDAAPAEVRIEGVRISDCLVKDATTGDVQSVGATLLETARQLAERRRAEELGYLVGAARRGSERTQGIHGEIVTRLEQEARPLSDARAYARGLRAGQASG